MELSDLFTQLTAAVKDAKATQQVSMKEGLRAAREILEAKTVYEATVAAAQARATAAADAHAAARATAKTLQQEFHAFTSSELDDRVRVS